MRQARYQIARESLGWSTAVMGERMGVSAGTIRHWETGKYPPSLEKLELMEEVTGFPIPYLLGYDAGWPNLMEPIPISSLGSMHGTPVWTQDYGWGLVNNAEQTFVRVDGTTLPLTSIAGRAYVIPPAFAMPVYGYGEPLGLDALPHATRVWVEPVGVDEHCREALRGWYRPFRDIFVENEIGQRFYLATYGAKWLAFDEHSTGQPFVRPDEKAVERKENETT